MYKCPQVLKSLCGTATGKIEEKQGFKKLVQSCCNRTDWHSLSKAGTSWTLPVTSEMADIVQPITILPHKLPLEPSGSRTSKGLCVDTFFSEQRGRCSVWENVPTAAVFFLHMRKVTQRGKVPWHL